MSLIFLFCMLTLGQGIFLVIYLITSKKRRAIPTYLLASIILIELLTLYDEVFLFFRESNLPASIYYIGTPLMAAIGPLCLYYIQFSSKQKQNLKWTAILHLIPALLAISFAIYTYHSLSYSEKLAYINYFHQTLTGSGVSKSLLETFINHSFRIFTLVYLGIAWTYLSRATARSTSHVNKGFIKFLLLGLMSICLVTMILEFLPSSTYAPWRFSLFLIVFSSHIFGLAYSYFRPPKKLIQADKYQRSGLKTDDEQLILAKLDQLIHHEKVYTDQLLTLQKLAHRTETNGHYLSQVINTKYHQSYNELINSLRVEEAKRLLSSSKANYSIDEIANKSGFASSSTFFRVFKTHTSQTPRQFQKKNQNPS